MRRALRFALPLVTALALTAGVAPAAGPPYASSEGDSYCSGLLDLTTCQATFTADHATGALGLDVTITSPAGGTLSGDGYGGAWGRIGVPIQVPEHPARTYLPITVTYHVGSAQASGSQSLLGGAASSASLYAYMDYEACRYCVLVGNTSLRLVDSYESSWEDGPPSRANEDIVISAYVARSGAPLPPGEITLWVEVYGYADMYFQPGTAGVVVQGALADVTVG